MFGIGLLARGYAPVVVGVDLNERHMPHGVMLGAGVVALVQIVVALRGAQRAQRSADDTDEPGSARGTLAGGSGAFGIAAGLVAVVGGVHAELSIGMLVAFVVFAAVAALVSELVVGISAMHAGWFPAPTWGTISKPDGFCEGRGGRGAWRHRGVHSSSVRNSSGFAVAALVVFLFYESYFSRDLLPPVDRVFAATIEAGADPGIAGTLLVWAVPGALIQLLGGPARQLGILFATGLLIDNPVAGWTALLALGGRCTCWQVGS
jgi:uncharacterized oligopeptide transporter (OPT) family protein